MGQSVQAQNTNSGSPSLIETRFHQLGERRETQVSHVVSFLDAARFQPPFIAPTDEERAPDLEFTSHTEVIRVSVYWRKKEDDAMPVVMILVLVTDKNATNTQIRCAG